MQAVGTMVIKILIRIGTEQRVGIKGQDTLIQKCYKMVMAVKSKAGD